jgi:hypothetical protein
MTPTTHPDPDDPGIESEARELDSRTSDGLHVQLLWHPQDGHVSVLVTDTKTADAFELQVRHGQSALDVFQHPYAYTPSRPATASPAQRRRSIEASG